ncbi:hypothetical protein GGR56DRAFT_686858 [Xylariaceae sp. FL0804]|nr:hypothetical protein GGR56DRAFT_686858 [Xylariaceae sp. FL0804]
MRNLLDLGRDMALSQASSSGRRIGSQLVTSIGVIDHAGKARVEEECVPVSAALPTGYCEAKWICEQMLNETMHKYPALFRPMVVRPGQITGSTKSGVWNPVEHFAFIVKSAQAIRAWPDLDGAMQWVPVNDAAATMAELLHPWRKMSPVLADALDIPSDRIVPYQEWLQRIKRSPLSETDVPAARLPLMDFLSHDFQRMSCGGLVLDTTKAQRHSKTMARLGPVSPDVAVKYVETWKQMGFLTS